MYCNIARRTIAPRALVLVLIAETSEALFVYKDRLHGKTYVFISHSQHWKWNKGLCDAKDNTMLRHKHLNSNIWKKASHKPLQVLPSKTSAFQRKIFYYPKSRPTCQHYQIITRDHESPFPSPKQGGFFH